MPKATRRKSTGHEQSAKLVKRQLAVPDSAIEHVEVGSKVEASGNEILNAMIEDTDAKPMKKKEKQALKHESFMKRLESTRTPYSKSHERRLKRKAKEQVAGGLEEIHLAIAALDTENPPELAGETGAPTDERAHVPKVKPGQIGEGKNATLSKSQRRRALQMERLRIPFILSNPQFTATPFQTIRTHAQNTLVKHQVPGQLS